MRLHVVVLAALLALVAPIGAQQATPLLEDGSNDETFQVAGSPQTPPADQGAAADLRSLVWTENPDGFHFALEVREVGPSAASQPFDSVEYFIGFNFEGVDYAVVVERYTDFGGAAYHYGYVGPSSTNGQYRDVDYEDGVEITIDEEANTIEGLVRRSALVDAEGAPAGVGDVMADFFVESSGSRFLSIDGQTVSLAASDRMPDSGVAGIVEVAFGIVQDGDARLFSEAPYRLSNGGATSLVYQVEAQNLGERQSFSLAVESLPQGWTVSLPFDRLVLDEQETRSFPVLLTTSSDHQHGGAKNFLLTMTGDRDGRDVGRIEVGIKYSTIPQPAGHHPTLYIHSYRPWITPLPMLDEISPGLFFGGVEGYLNAAPPEEDPRDTQEPIPTYGNIIPGPGWFEWHMPLRPELGMGLDFDTSKTATLSLPISYDYVAQNVEIAATLYYEGERDEFAVATSIPMDPVSFGPQAQPTIELTMTIDRRADFIEYRPSSWLYLVIEMEGIFAGPSVGPGSVPSIEPGGRLDLPLVEYHDPVDRFYRAVESLAFAQEYLERPVNPAETIVFETRLRNVGTEKEPVSLNLTGTNLAWARILGQDSFDLAPGQERTVAVAISVPANTPDGAIVDLVLQAASDRDPFRRAVMDLIAIVDEEADHPDESGKISGLDKKLGDDKKSPGFEIAAVGLGMLAVALVLRRRR